MDKLAAGCGVAIVGLIFVFLAMIVSTFLGGVSGWIVGAWFPYVTDTLRELAGVNLTDFQLGATLGFFGSAFRSVQSNS